MAGITGAFADLRELPVPREWRPWPADVDPWRRPVPMPTAPEPIPVSVIVPAYNRAHLIGRALASVAAQRPQPAAEVIVVDDASTDGTAEIAERSGATVIRHDVNRGAASARNTGIEAATQPWLALLDSDDEWLAHLLASLWPMRGEHVLVSGSPLTVGPSPGEDRVGGPPGRRPLVLRSPAPLVFPHNFIASSGVIVRRDTMLAAGGYRTDLRYAEDFDVWLRVLEHGTAVASPVVVCLYHRHEGQKSFDLTGPRSAQRTVVQSHSGAAWWSARLVEQRIAVDAWDDLRAAIRAGRPVETLRHATSVLRPVRFRAVLRLLRWRAGQRSRSSTVARDGGPTVALLPGTTRDRAADRPVMDLRAAPWPRVLLTLARHPAGAAVCPSRPLAVIVRRLGAEPV